MKRRRFSAEFKRKVVPEAMRGDETVRLIAARRNVNPNQAGKWKSEAHKGLLEEQRKTRAFNHGKTTLTLPSNCPIGSDHLVWVPDFSTVCDMACPLFVS